MRGPTERTVLSYGFSFACVAAAVVLSETLGKWAEPDFTGLYVLAVLVASSIGGLGPGLFATFVSAVATAYAQGGWTYQVDLGWDDVFRVAVFVIAAVVVSSLAAHRHAAEEQLRRADRAKDEFLAVLSHELKTPLTSILGWSSILEMGSGDAQTIAAAADSIKQSARAQQRLVEDLLDVSRIIFAKFDLQVRPLDLVSLVRSAGDLMRPVAKSKDVELVIELPQTPCVIEGDEHRLEQVVWNLLSNAMKFTPAGGRVALQLAAVDSQARVIVTDNGEGIDAKTLPHIFDRFHQGNGSVTKGGLGLGLAIARHVVKAHRGAIEARSAGPGKGATFIASFPLND